MQSNKRSCINPSTIRIQTPQDLVWSIAELRVRIIGWQKYFEQLDQQVVCMEDLRKVVRVIKIWLDAHAKTHVSEVGHKLEVEQKCFWWSEGVRILSPYTIKSVIFDKEDMLFGEKGTWGALKVNKHAIHRPCFAFKREKHGQSEGHLHRRIIMTEDMDPLYRYVKAGQCCFDKHHSCCVTCMKGGK